MRIGPFQMFGARQVPDAREIAQMLRAEALGALDAGGGIATDPEVPPLAISQPVRAGEAGSFSNLLEHAVGEVDARLKTAEAAKTAVMTGETNNLHQAMISMQEASVAFQLMVEVRNKLVESYQELMRMQV